MRFITIKKKTLLSAVALILCGVAAIVGTAITGSAAVWNNRVERKLPIYSVETESNHVAISFDASWGAEKTPKLLEIVTEYDIKATFFSVGFWAEKYSDQLISLSESGRFEIATHSNTHPDMAKLSAAKIRQELETSVSIIKGITGKEITLFRPPYGSYSDTLIQTATSLNLHTVQWSVDSLDWKGLSASDIASRVVSGAKKGSIILMHNDGENTVEALPVIIEGIKNKGLEFVTIGELIYQSDYYIDHTGRQFKNRSNG